MITSPPVVAASPADALRLRVEAFGPPSGAHHPARASVPLVGWLPSDDDILPQGAVKRKGRRGR